VGDQQSIELIERLCFGTTDGHLTMDGRQAFGAKSEQFRTRICVIIIFFIDDSYRNNARQH
jgi:hypothetical protein